MRNAMDAAALDRYITGNYGEDQNEDHSDDPLPERHPDDCECDDCRAMFNAIMWGWVRPEHLAVADREARTGDIPIA